MKKLLIALLFLTACKKEPTPPVKICYQCQLIINGIYIANIDTCIAGPITAPQLNCKQKNP